MITKKDYEEICELVKYHRSIGRNVLLNDSLIYGVVKDRTYGTVIVVEDTLGLRRIYHRGDFKGYNFMIQSIKVVVPLGDLE